MGLERVPVILKPVGLETLAHHSGQPVERRSPDHAHPQRRVRRTAKPTEAVAGEHDGATPLARLLEGGNGIVGLGLSDIAQKRQGHMVVLPRYKAPLAEQREPLSKGAGFVGKGLGQL